MPKFIRQEQAERRLTRFPHRLPLVTPPRVEIIPGRHLKLRPAGPEEPFLHGYEKLRLVSPWRGAVPWTPLMAWAAAQNLCRVIPGWTLRGTVKTEEGEEVQAEVTGDLNSLVSPIGAALDTNLRGARLGDRLDELWPEERLRLIPTIVRELEERGYGLTPTEVPALSYEARDFTGVDGRTGLLLLAADSRNLDGIWFGTKRPQLPGEDRQSGGLLLWPAILSPPQGNGRVSALNPELDRLKIPTPLQWQD